MALLPQERSLPRQDKAAEAPAPGFLDAIGASFRGAYRDLAGADIDEKRGSYNPIVDALTAANGKPWSIYVDPHSGQVDDDGIWRDIAAMRARKPDFLAELGAREQWEQATEKRLAAERGRDRADEAKSGLAPWLIGKVGGAMVDPINIGSAMIGLGPAGSLGRLAVREAAINALTEAVEQPIIAYQRAQRGEELTPAEAAGNIAGAAVFGAAFGVGGRLAGDYVLQPIGERARAAIYPRLPQGWQDRIAAGMTLGDVAEAEIGRGNMTAPQRAAADVLRREAEIDAGNPFVPDGSGAAAHRTLLEEALRSITGDAPSPTLKARLRASTAAAPGRRVDLPGDVVGFFRAKGYSEAQARGIAAGIAAESGGSHVARNPTSGAFGLGQWLGSRRDALHARYGPNPTREQQLEFLHWELQGGDHGGRAVLAAADEAGALDAYIRKFMRPAPGAETDGDLARGMAALGRSGEAPPARVAGDGDAEAALADAMRARGEAGAAIGEDMPRVADAADGAAAAAPVRAPHISVQVGDVLEANGFVREGNVYRRRIEGVAEPGSLSDGGRVVTVQMDESGRWLELLDGFDVARDADLRAFAGDPVAAVNRVLEGVPLPEPVRPAPARTEGGRAETEGAPAPEEAPASPLRLLQAMWERQAERGERPAHVWAARSQTGDVVKVGGDIKGWSLSKRDAMRRFGGDDVRIVKIKPPSRATRDGFDDPQGDLFATARMAELFSDPGGPAAKAQRASLEHDLKAVLHRQAQDSPQGDTAPAGPTYRLDEEGPEMTAQQLAEEIAEEDAAIAAVRGCL